MATRTKPGFRAPGFTIALFALIVVAVVILAPSIKAVVEQRQQIADMQASVAGQKQRLEQLKDDRARWSDPSYIRAQARDRLMYVMPGETSYLVIDDRAPSVTVPDETPVSAEVQKTRSDWTHSLFASLVTAGTTQQPPAEAPSAGSGKK